jgi:hypothetical protein
VHSPILRQNQTFRSANLVELAPEAAAMTAKLQRM